MSVVKSGLLRMGNDRDTKFLPELVMQTAQNFTVRVVSGDKAYSSRTNLELVNELGAVPYILFKKGNDRKSQERADVEKDVLLL